MIHPTAVISPEAELGEGVEIGPYSVVGEGVQIGDGCRLHSHVVIAGKTKIGTKNEFFPFAAIGQRSQDLKDKGWTTYLEIGDRNTFRESVTIHRSSMEDTVTRIGHDNFFLAYSHVAHDCIVGNHCIFSNNGSLAGHCIVEDHVIVSGLSGVHQFCRLGAHSIIAGMARVTKDVPPYMVAEGHPAAVRGINKVGLGRRGFTEEDLRCLKVAYRTLFFRKETPLNNSTESLKVLPEVENPHVENLLAFIAKSERGITR